MASTPEAIRCLLAAGADPRIQDNDRQTAADVVKARMQWIRESLPDLKELEAERRMTKLQKVLDRVRGRGPV